MKRAICAYFFVLSVYSSCSMAIDIYNVRMETKAIAGYVAQLRGQNSHGQRKINRMLDRLNGATK